MHTDGIRGRGECNFFKKLATSCLPASTCRCLGRQMCVVMVTTTGSLLEIIHKRTIQSITLQNYRLQTTFTLTLSASSSLSPYYPDTLTLETWTTTAKVLTTSNNLVESTSCGAS
jgi:hypothetical protein